jgi:hypothetical protein
MTEDKIHRKSILHPVEHQKIFSMKYFCLFYEKLKSLHEKNSDAPLCFFQHDMDNVIHRIKLCNVIQVLYRTTTTQRVLSVITIFSAAKIILIFHFLHVGMSDLMARSASKIIFQCLCLFLRASWLNTNLS